MEIDMKINRATKYIFILLIVNVLVVCKSTIALSQASLINIFDTTGYSSDPSGLTYFPNSGNLLLVDSEIEETPFFTGSNLFELTTAGVLVAVHSTTGFSNEPTGVTFNAITGTLFITDDNLRMVFEVNPLSLDVVSSFSTLDFGNNDPEGITSDANTGNLYIVDGLGKTVYEVTTSGVLVSSFPVPVVIKDPEGIYFDAGSGNLFVISSPNEDLIFELTTTGIVVNIIDIQSFGVIKPKGITFAPSSDPGDDPGIFHIYVADYGIDEVNDGRIFEILLDGNILNNPPQIDSGPTATPNQIYYNETAQLSVQASDVDEDSLTYSWTTLPGEGSITGAGSTVTYTPPPVTEKQTFTITVTIFDGQGGSVTGTVVVKLSPIPQAGWSLLHVDSEELVGEDGAAENSFDGNVDTFWHTQWRSSNPPHPHEIQICLNQLYNSINGFRYLPRQDGGDNGRIEQFEFYVSMDGIEWGEPVATGTLIDDVAEKEVAFAPKAGLYIRLRALSAYDGDPWTSMAEINVLVNQLNWNNTPPQIDVGPTVTPSLIMSNETAELNVQASDVDGDSLTYIWTTLPGEGSITGTGNTVTYNPPSVTIQQTFTVTVTIFDGQGGSVTGTVSVTVDPGPINNPPQLDSDPTATPPQIMYNETTELSVVASDIDGDALTYTWKTLPGEGIITGTGNTVTYTPPAVTVQQAFTIIVTVSDGKGGIATGTVDVTVVPAGGGGVEVTFTPVADAAVHSNNPTTNYGSVTILSVDGSPTRISYLRFEVTGVTGAVQSARIRLNCLNGSAFGGTAHSLSNIVWSEDTITYNTKPVIDGPALFTQGQVDVGDVVELDVTPAIGGDGIYSFAIVSDNNDGVRYGAREDLINQPILRIITDGESSGNTPPKIDNGPTATPNQILSAETAELKVQASDVDGDTLIYSWTTLPGQGIVTGTGDTVTYAPPSVAVQQTFTITVTVVDGKGGIVTSTVDVTVVPAGGGGVAVTFTPMADAYVHSNSPNSNYGFTSTLNVDGSPVKISYLMFDVTGITGAVQSARIRLNCVNGSAIGGTAHSLSNIVWSEGIITYDTKPVIDGPALFTQGQVDVGDIVEMDVTPAISGDGIYSFAIVSNINNGVSYRSREDTVNPPALIIISESN
jgi:hypothetical protein